jgi:dienelactone hydrolase
MSKKQLVMIAIGIVLLLLPQLWALENEGRVFNVGLRMLDFVYHSGEGDEIITVAVWYPTYEIPKRFVYHEQKNYESKVAFEAALPPEQGPYPLILFAHGAYGCGFNSAFFMEYIARHGYIAVAPDYKDTQGPSYTKQIAFSRMEGGTIGRSARVLRIAKQFIVDMEADRDLLFSYLAKYRLNPSSFVIDKILELNRDKNSFLYQSINEQQIGMCGHSLGGLTSIGKIGASPDPKFKDARIKAGLIFSGAVYPFEDTINNINVPIMLMRGDNDPANLGEKLGIDRKVLYDRAKPPKYYLVLKDATHFSFSNRACGDTPLYQAVQSNAQVKAICEYGLAFWERYIRGNITAEKNLQEITPAWVYYKKEEVPGMIFERGEEPTSMEGISEVIKKEIKKKDGERKGLLKRLLERRQKTKRAPAEKVVPVF